MLCGFWPRSSRSAPEWMRCVKHCWRGLGSAISQVISYDSSHSRACCCSLDYSCYGGLNMSQRAAPSSISTEFHAARAAWTAMIKERLQEFGRQGTLVIWAIRPIFDLAIAALVYAGGAKDLVPYIVVSMTANSLVW